MAALARRLTAALRRRPVRQLALLLLLLTGCGDPAGTATAPPTPAGVTTESVMSEIPFDLLVYAASGGQPPVTARLEITGAGQATLLTETSWSVPPDLRDRAGTFAGPVPADLWDELAANVSAAGLLSQARRDQATSPDPTTRSLTLRRGEQETNLRLVDSSDDPALAAVETTLIDIMTALLAQPLRAVALSLDLVDDGATVTPTVSLTHLGREPLPILLYDPDAAGMWLRLTPVVEKGMLISPDELMWLPASSTVVTLETVAALAADGAFVSGVHEMAPGAVYTLPLDPVPLPAGEAYVALRLRAVFWFPGTGPARRLVTLELPRVILRDGS